ncbi:hypothetical protein DFQ30_010988 [Apophysomyces sp. BC1015]|nr:hypothetical protein DFQ30_010988 [Apophysomyces sp. BC1015]
MATEQVKPVADNAPVASIITIVEENVHKVFVGNLSFQTTEEGLTKFFETSGKVLNAHIITRGPRSLGYGFVSYATIEEAEKATSELDKEELDGREINVEVARPKEAGSAPSRPRRRRRSARAKAKAQKAQDRGVSEDSSSDEKPEVRAAPKGKREVSSTPSEGTDATEDEEAVPRARARKPRRNRARKASRVKHLTEPSKSTLFVANLPYAATDDDLTVLFKAYKVKSVHVARMRNGRSKGYGFVEMETEEEQKNALEKVKDVVMDGRSIYLKIAMSEQAKEDDEAEETSDVAATEAKKENGVQAEPAKREVPKKEEPKAESVKKEEPKKEAPKAESVKKEEPKKEESKKEESKKEESKKEEPKKEEPKKEEPKKEESKKEEPKKEEPKKEAPKAEAPKAEAGKVEPVKKEAPKA